MTPFFTRERFGSPQAIAALLLLIYLLQCAWLVSRELRTQQSTSIGEQERIHAGLLQWHGKGVAGTPGLNPPAETGMNNDGYDDIIVGANGYSVQRSTVSGGPYEAIGCPTTTSFTDAGVTRMVIPYVPVTEPVVEDARRFFEAWGNS